MLQGPFRVPSFNGYIPRRMPLLPVLVQGAPSEIYPTAHDRRGNDGMLSRNDVFPHRHRRAHHLPALGHSAYKIELKTRSCAPSLNHGMTFNDILDAAIAFKHSSEVVCGCRIMFSG